MVRSGDEHGPFEGFLVDGHQLGVVQGFDDVFSSVGSPFVLGGGEPGRIMCIEVAHDEDVSRVVEQGHKVRYVPLRA